MDKIHIADSEVDDEAGSEFGVEAGFFHTQVAFDPYKYFMNMATH